MLADSNNGYILKDLENHPSLDLDRHAYGINQGPLITDGRNRNEMFSSKISLARMPWHFKSNEDIITKFK